MSLKKLYENVLREVEPPETKAGAGMGRGEPEATPTGASAGLPASFSLTGKEVEIVALAFEFLKDHPGWNRYVAQNFKKDFDRELARKIGAPAASEEPVER